MEVIDQHNFDELHWFGYVSENPREQPPLSFRIALEDFYKDNIDEEIYLGYIKYEINPIYLIGTKNLNMINKLNKCFGETISVFTIQSEILCII